MSTNSSARSSRWFMTKLRVNVYRTELANELLRVPANLIQLRQVIMNLVTNAVDAMHDVADRDRVLRIKTETHDRSHVIITAEDSGTGIDPKNRLLGPSGAFPCQTVGTIPARYVLSKLGRRILFWSGQAKIPGMDPMGHTAPLVILGLSFVFFGWALVALASRQKNKDR
jgi:hypothetical protein